MSQYFLESSEAEVGVRATVVDKDGAIIDEVRVAGMETKGYPPRLHLHLDSFLKYPGGRVELVALEESPAWYNCDYDFDENLVIYRGYPLRLDLFAPGQLQLF